MRLSTSTNILYERINGEPVAQETSIRLCAQAGYEVLDFCFHDSVTSKSRFVTDQWQEYVNEMRHLGEGCGVEFPLGHSVVYDFCQNDIDALYYDRMTERCILGAEMLGVSWLVMHPSTVAEEKFCEKKPASRRKNVDFFRKWGQFAAAHHVGLAIEGMWDASLRLDARYATTAEELAELADGVGLSNVAVCWDFEHGSIMGIDQKNAVKKLGNRLKTVHISDQTGIGNIHILPYQGVTNWDEILEALAESGYKGEFNYEIQWYLRRMPEELLLPSLRHSAEIGKWMIRRLEGFRR